MTSFADEHYGISVDKPKTSCRIVGYNRTPGTISGTQGRIPDIARIGRIWLIPKAAPKPLDGGTKAAKRKAAETLRNNE
jgi:hypothetical protein